LSLWDISPDGRLAAGGGGGATRLYDLQTGTQLGAPYPRKSSVTWGTFSLDGRSLVVGGLDGDPQITWDIDPASWREKACTVAGRNMTKAEWEKYMPAGEPYRAICPGYSIET
jgi:hypothetical protein